MLTPQEYTTKLQTRLKQARPEIERGIARVTEAPGKKAAAKASKMLNGITESVNSGQWARRVGAVPLDEWKDKMMKKGVGRISTGIDEAGPKIMSFAEEFLPYLQRVQNELNSMPDATQDDRDMKMLRNVQLLREFKRRS